MKLQAVFCILAAGIFGIRANSTGTAIGDLGGKVHIDLIGGEDALPNTWPWHAALYSYGEFSCSATLISDRWILTAAHCLFNVFNRQILAARFSVRLGLHLLITRDPNEQMRNVSKVIVYPEFQYITVPNSGQLLPIHDLGLLQLSAPVMQTTNVRWISLPLPRDNLLNGASAYGTGWGYIYQDVEGRQEIYNITGWGIITSTTTLTVQPDALQQLEMTIDTGKNCTDITHGKTDMICVSNPVGGTGPCQGDSGGPLVAQKNRKWILYGVLSFGPLECAQAGVTGVYTKVAPHVSWILNNTQTSTPGMAD